jgi:hypothetical protein
VEKAEIAAYVRTILTEKARDIYLRNHEFDYYGWVAKAVPPDQQHLPHVDRGHWLGATQEAEARQLVADAEDAMEKARAELAGLKPGDTTYDAAKALVQWAADQVKAAQDHLGITLDTIQKAIERRRQFRLDKLVSKLFLRYYHRARHMEWELFDTRLPAQLRNYLMLQFRGQKLSPTAMVFLWLVVEENLDHGGVFQVKGLGATDYLAQHALATSSLDTDAPEDRPTRMEEDYIRELQRPDAVPTHENLDPRSTENDHTYDGLPSLGALDGKLVDKHTCPTCGTQVRDRIVSLRGRYYGIEGCDNYATKCRYEPITSGFTTRKAAVEHLEILHALERAG